MQLKNPIKVCMLMTRHIKTSTGKEQTLTGEKSELFMFQGGFPFSRGLRGYYMEDKKTMNISRTKKILKSQLFILFPSAFHYTLYRSLPVGANRKIQITKNKEKGLG